MSKGNELEAICEAYSRISIIITKDIYQRKDQFPSHTCVIANELVMAVARFKNVVPEEFQKSLLKKVGYYDSCVKSLLDLSRYKFKGKNLIEKDGSQWGYDPNTGSMKILKNNP